MTPNTAERTIVFYQKPTCTACRQVFAELKEGGADFNRSSSELL